MNDCFRGYVLRTVDYKDNDLILSILTEDEIVTVLARGTKKINSKRKSLTHPYSYCEFEVTKSKGGHLALSGGVLLNYPSKVEKSLTLILLLSILSHYILNLNETNFGYYLFTTSLELIEGEVNPKLILLAILNEIAGHEGLMFNVDECVKCGSKKSIVYFSYEHGGFCCKKCSNHHQNKEYLSQMRILLKINLSNCDKIVTVTRTTNEVIVRLIEALEDRAGIKFNAKSMLLATINKED